MIFVLKRREYKEFLSELEKGKTIVVHDYAVNKDSSTYKGERYFAFLGEIYDPKSKKSSAF